MSINNERIIFCNKEKVTLEYAGEIAYKLYELEQKSTQPIMIIINSKGGYDCKFIITAIKASKSKVYTCGLGNITEEAALILASGVECVMFKDTEIKLTANGEKGLKKFGCVIEKKYEKISNFIANDSHPYLEEGQKVIIETIETFAQFNDYWKLKNDEYQKQSKA